MKKLSVVLTLYVVVTSVNTWAIYYDYYDDGQEHTINSPVTDSIYICNADIHRGDPTTANLISGGIVNHVDVHDTSSFNVYSGGVVNSDIFATDESNVSIFASGVVNGEISALHHSNISINSDYGGIIELYDYSQTTVTNANNMWLMAGGESYAEISGGIIEHIVSSENSHVVFSNGQVGGDFGAVFVADNSTFDVSGGTIDFISGEGFSNVNITGGQIDLLSSTGGSTVEVYGGQIGGGMYNNLISGDPDFSDTGLIIIHGTDFNYDYGYIPDFSGILTGTLLSGDPINVPFERFHDAQVLLVPEPATLLMFGMGGMVSVRGARRKKY